MKTETISLRTRSGAVLETVEIVAKVSRGSRSHKLGDGCFGKHTLAYAMDIDGNCYRTTSASNWRRCTPSESEAARDALRPHISGN